MGLVADVPASEVATTGRVPAARPRLTPPGKRCRVLSCHEARRVEPAKRKPMTSKSKNLSRRTGHLVSCPFHREPAEALAFGGANVI